MTSIIKVDQITSTGSDTPALTVHDNGVTLNKPLTDGNGDLIMSTTITGQSLQIVASQFHSGTSHVSVTTSSNPSAHGVFACCDITVKSASSVNDVSLFTSMSYGGAGVLMWYLKYSLDSGSTWTNIVGNEVYGTHSIVGGSQQIGNNGATSLNGAVQSLSAYGWAYDNMGWGARSLRFFHDHNQPAGTTIRYGVFCTNTSSVTNYFMHANSQMGNFRIEEIGDMGR